MQLKTPQFQSRSKAGPHNKRNGAQKEKKEVVVPAFSVESDSLSHSYTSHYEEPIEESNNHSRDHKKQGDLESHQLKELSEQKNDEKNNRKFVRKQNNPDPNTPKVRSRTTKTTLNNQNKGILKTVVKKTTKDKKNIQFKFDPQSRNSRVSHKTGITSSNISKKTTLKSKIVSHPLQQYQQLKNKNQQQIEIESFFKNQDQDNSSFKSSGNSSKEDNYFDPKIQNYENGQNYFGNNPKNLKNNKNANRNSSQTLQLQKSITKYFIAKELKILTGLFLSGLIVALVVLYWFMNSLNAVSVQLLEGSNLRLVQTIQFFDYQRFYISVLQKISYSQEVYSKDRFANFDFEESRNLFPYQVSDLGQYTSNKIKEASERLKDSESPYQESISDKRWIQETLFTGNMAIINFEGFKLNVKNETYFKSRQQFNQVVFSLPYDKSVIFNLYEGFPLNADIRYLVFNTENGISINYIIQVTELALKQVASFATFVIYSLWIMGGSGIFILVASVLSICTIFRVSSKFRRVYLTFKGLNQKDIRKRQDQLKLVQEQISITVKMGYFHDVIPGSLIGNQIIGVLSKKKVGGVVTGLSKGKKQAKNKTKILQKKKQQQKVDYKNEGVYFFRLGSTLVFFVLFYVVQLCLLGLILLLLLDVRYTLQTIGETLSFSNLVPALHVLFIAYFEQRMVLAPDALFLFTKGNEMKELRMATLQSTQAQILKLFDQSGTTFQYGPLVSRFSELQSASLCSYTSKLQKKQELCNLLNDGILNNGMKQVMVSIQDTMEELMRQIQDEKVDMKEIAENQSWKELQFTFENVYVEASVQLVKEMNEFTNQFVRERIQTQIMWVIQLLMSFSVFCVLFLGLALNNLVEQSSRVMFSYRLLHWDTLVKNRQVRHGLKRLLDLKEAS